MVVYETLQFSDDFIESYASREFSASDRRRILNALRLLDTNEQHPSLRVHQLEREMKGWWSASASDELRIVFERLDGGRKRLIECNRHYRR
jgi:mRNA-degrading endonuclease YafQ of YafQ-DinJ toxin-antitoxin module